MIEIDIFKRNQINKILEEHGIQQRDFSLLESPKYHLTDDEEIEILKEKIATLIERLGADKLIKIVLMSSRIILSNQEKNNFKYKANKEIFSTIFKAIRFVKDKNDEILADLESGLLAEHYSDFIKSECVNANPEQLKKIKQYLLGITYMNISHPRSKKVDIEKIKYEVRKLFPDVFMHRFEVRDKN